MFGGLFRGRRGRREVAGDVPGAGAPPTPAPAGWTTLPPLHPVSGPVPASVDSVGFARTLTTRTVVQPALRPPEHIVSAEGGGVVRGLTSVVAHGVAATNPPVVDLQRSAAHRAAGGPRDLLGGWRDGLRARLGRPVAEPPAAVDPEFSGTPAAVLAGGTPTTAPPATEPPAAEPPAAEPPAVEPPAVQRLAAGPAAPAPPRTVPVTAAPLARAGSPTLSVARAALLSVVPPAITRSLPAAGPSGQPPHREPVGVAATGARAANARAAGEGAAVATPIDGPGDIQRASAEPGMAAPTPVTARPSSGPGHTHGSGETSGPAPASPTTPAVRPVGLDRPLGLGRPVTGGVPRGRPAQVRSAGEPCVVPVQRSTAGAGAPVSPGVPPTRGMPAVSSPPVSAIEPAPMPPPATGGEPRDAAPAGRRPVPPSTPETGPAPGGNPPDVPRVQRARTGEPVAVRPVVPRAPASAGRAESPLRGGLRPPTPDRQPRTSHGSANATEGRPVMPDPGQPDAEDDLPASLAPVVSRVVQRSPVTPDPAGLAPGAATDAPVVVPAQAPWSPTQSAVPTVGRRLPRTAVQRAPAGDGGPAASIAPEPAHAAFEPAPPAWPALPEHRATVAPPTFQRAANAMTVHPGRATPAYRPAVPLMSRPQARPRPWPADDPGEMAVAAGTARRDPDGSVVFAPPPAAAAVQRAVAAPPSSADPGGDRPASPPPAAPAAPALVPAADAVAGPSAAPDMAAMADELYERIERRLRTDLFLERERRGALADL